MDQPENNDLSIEAVLSAAIDLPFVKVKHYLSTSNGNPLPYRGATIWFAPDNQILTLECFLDQKSALSYESMIELLESKIKTMCNHSDMYFISRSCQTEPQGLTVVLYTLEGRPKDGLLSNLNKFLREKAEKEFIEVLEAKLLQS